MYFQQKAAVKDDPLTYIVGHNAANRVARLYWSDKQTDLVSDVPSEARIDAAQFGRIMIGK